MEQTFILSIDQSTSGTKALLIDRAGMIVSRTTLHHAQYYPHPGWVEHDPVEIIEKTYCAVQELLAKTSVTPEQILAIGLTNQRETVLIWDKHSGRPVHNAIVWQCQRATEICEKITADGYGSIVKYKTGLVLSPYFPAAKIKWQLDNVSGLRERACLGDLLFGTIDSWLIWNLTNGKIHATDYSNASRTQLYNIKEKCWDAELFDLFDIPLAMAPKVCDSNALFGYTVPESVFQAAIPIYAVMGDSQAALFGQHCVEKGMTKATYGTGSSVMMNIGNEPEESKNGLVTSIAWGISGSIKYVLEGNINCTGDTLQWLANELRLIDDASSSQAIAATVDDTDGVYLIPAFVGLGAPYWDSNARAAIVGMSRGTSRAHVVRAAVEAIAYQIRDVVDLMVQDSNTMLKELRVDGGPTRNDLLMQFQSDILNVQVTCSGIEELSAVGVGYMAGLEQGFWDSMEQIRTLQNTRQFFTPHMDNDRREMLYGGWKNAIGRVKSRI